MWSEPSSGQVGLWILPAAIVSPPRRIKILPISLLFVKVSRGIPRATAAEPDTCVFRKVICTSAEVPFPRILMNSQFQSRVEDH